MMFQKQLSVRQRTSELHGLIHLAQSILLDKSAFVTKLDLNFTTKDAAIPVTVSIREMVNGFPTQTVVPFSEVTLNPGAVSTSAATTFTFPSPVFLQDGVEYAIVIMANSNKYMYVSLRLVMKIKTVIEYHNNHTMVYYSNHRMLQHGLLIKIKT